MQEKKTSKNNNNNLAGPGSQHDLTLNSGGKEKKNIFLRFEDDVKSGIFNVMYLLLKDSDISKLKLSILLFIEFLQMLQYAFSENVIKIYHYHLLQFKSVWKSDSVFYYVSSFLNFTHIEPWMNRVNFQAYIAVFYICVAIVTLTVSTFIFVAYQLQNSRSTFQFPQQALRHICIVTTTILFLPSLELFTSILVCVDGENLQKVHYIYKNEFKCWSGIHIIHATIAIIASIIYILLSFLITLTFYKNLYSSTDAASKTDSKADIQRLIQKVIVVYVFSFLTQERQQWFVLVLYFILSTLTFERYFYLRSYHHDTIQLQHNIYRAVCLWSNIIILISKILQKTAYNGGLQIFLMGTPLIITLAILNRDSRKEEMLFNLNKFQRGEDVARQIKFFLQIIHRKMDGDRNSDILLNGYIFLHEDTCPNQQCHLKMYKKNIHAVWQQRNQKTKSLNQSSIQKHIQNTQKMDNFQLLLSHAKNMYRAGIQKFPNCPALRISYSFFLMERLNKKQEAIIELNQASHMHPTFDEQFIIFRHKKLSEEYFEESSFGTHQKGSSQIDKYGQTQVQNAIDLITRFSFESTYRQLKGQIENCAQYHMEFWNHLKNDRPDLGKLGECGTKINNSISNVETLWNELMKINSNAPKAMKLYGRYQIEILQDRETGQEFLQRAKEFSSQKQNLLVGGLDGATDIHQISSDGTPCIFVSGEPEKLGHITQCNSGSVRVFGYQAYEMRNQKVENLMPELYSKNHQKILEEALAKGPENIPNKERLVFARHKSGYIFPVWLQLKLVQSLQTEIQFIALFKIDKRITNSNIGFVLINKERKIQGISSSCLKLMGGLDINMVKKIYTAGYDLHKMAPELEEKREEIAASKNGLQIEWNIPFIQKRKMPKAQEINGKISNLRGNNIMHGRKEENRGTFQYGADEHQKQRIPPIENSGGSQVIKKKFKFICQIIPIVMGSFGEIGSYIRLDQIRIDSNSKASYKQFNFQKKKDIIKQPLFQFTFDIYSGKFIREMKDAEKQQKTPFGKNPQYFQDEDYYKQSTHESGKENNLKNQLIPGGQNSTTDVSADAQQAPTLESGNEIIVQDTPGPEAASIGSGLHTLHHHVHSEDFYSRKKKWGKDIQIYSLRDGKVVLKDQIDEEKRLIEMEEEKKRKKAEEEKNMMELTNFTSNIKSKNALRSALIDSAQSKAIRNLKLTMNIVILFLLALAISEFTVISGQFQEINENFGMIEKSYKRISEIQRISFDIRTLILINEGRLKQPQTYLNSASFGSSIDIKDFMKDDIDEALNSLYDLQDTISLSQLSLSSPHHRLINSKTVPLYFLESKKTLKVINFTLTEAVLQLSSAIFTVRHLSATNFSETQEDIFFVTYNSFNDFLLALQRSSFFFEQELYKRSSEKNNLLLTLFVSSIVIIVLSIPILFPAVNSVNQSKDRVLALFIEIPNTFIDELGKKCEGFLGSFDSEEQQEDEVKSEDIQSVKQENDQTGGNAMIGAKRNIGKQAKNSSNTSRQFFIQFSIVVALAIAYFSSMFSIAQRYLDSIEIITQEISILAKNEANFAFIQNTQREMFYNLDKKIFNQSSFEISKKALRQGTLDVQKYLDAYQMNRNYHSDSYSTDFKTLMNTDLCNQRSIFKLDLIPIECSSLFNNGPEHGLQTIMIMYFDLLRETLTAFQNATQSVSIIKNLTIQASALRNASDVLINDPKLFRPLFWMQFRFLQTAFRLLITSLRSTTQQGFQTSVNTKVALFVIFIISVVLGYIIIWSPFVSRLSKDILRTKLMLTIIPIHIIIKIPKIQEFLNKQAKGAYGGGGASKNGGDKGHHQGRQENSNSK